MEINEGTCGKIRHILPVQRGRVAVQNITFIRALLYICENGCKWRRLPKEYGNWHVIYKRFNRWVKDGIIERLFRELHANGIVETARPLPLFFRQNPPQPAQKSPSRGTMQYQQNKFPQEGRNDQFRRTKGCKNHHSLLAD